MSNQGDVSTWRRLAADLSAYAASPLGWRPSGRRGGGLARRVDVARDHRGL